jgi:hypothetical protein
MPFMSGMVVLYVIGGAILAIIAVAVILSLPDIMRYIRINKM